MDIIAVVSVWDNKYPRTGTRIKYRCEVVIISVIISSCGETRRCKIWTEVRVFRRIVRRDREWNENIGRTCRVGSGYRQGTQNEMTYVARMRHDTIVKIFIYLKT